MVEDANVNDERFPREGLRVSSCFPSNARHGVDRGLILWRKPSRKPELATSKPTIQIILFFPNLITSLIGSQKVGLSI